MKLRTSPLIPARKRARIRDAVAFARKVIRVEHPIRIRAVSPNAISIDGRVAFGAFMFPPAPGDSPGIAKSERARPDIPLPWPLMIYVACGRKLRTEYVIENLLHELAHYEQWRDGKKMCERGIPQRAAALYRQFKEAR